MKRFFLIAVLLFGFVIASNAALVSSNLFTLATVNNTTNNGPAVAIGSAFLTPFTLFVQNTGLATTNALYVNFQIGFDTNNFTTIGLYTPGSTNGTIEPFNLTNNAATIYIRAQVVTTNSVVVGANVVKTQ